MFTKTKYPISSDLLKEAETSIPDVDFRLSLNKPTGDFFYDPWIIDDQFRGSIWERILNTLPIPIGEARLIKLEPGTCYRSHADIDDRWHLSIQGERSYLINLENDIMYPVVKDQCWHYIDAGIKHSAVNFGSVPRIQLVVRKLLSRNVLKDPINVSITLKKIITDRRFVFDDIVSPWLNKANKQGILQDFKFEEFEVKLTIEKSAVDNLKSTIDSHFNLEIKS